MEMCPRFRGWLVPAAFLTQANLANFKKQLDPLG
jgi:hypothetical protein